MNEEIAKMAEKAVNYDKAHEYEAAIYFYTQAAESLLNLQLENVRVDAVRYIERAEQLKQIEIGGGSSSTSTSDGGESIVKRAEFLLYQALNNDEKEHYEEAMQLYQQAIELCLESRKTTTDAKLVKQLNILATNACDRAERLKQLTANPTCGAAATAHGIDRLYVGDGTDIAPHQGKARSASNSPATPRRRAPSSSSKAGGFTAHELEVLRKTSTINGRSYVPFMSVDESDERFAYPLPFTDKDGLLLLADKQKLKLHEWSRPSDFITASPPTVIGRIDSGTIKQTIVSDCSFIASLAVAARYENLTGKMLITNCIYPQNKHGVPIYNPCGKYMVRLHLNGVARKIIIDDFLPIDANRRLLCSHSQRRDELWVSLLEKAYLKVMGGYNFPGSNSNIDLHALTGWIPERQAIQKGKADDFDFMCKYFDSMSSRMKRGDCLITVATGKLSQMDQDRCGLVECHAYAVLDLQTVLGKRMLLVKNPWTHLRWKGRYSEMDTTSWTTAMCKALKYNPQDAQQFDDGVFWIDFESLCHFFDVFYVNWNPALFPYTTVYHDSWSAGVGPVKDLYTIGDNPQYSLSIDTSKSDVAIWILLSRHITDKADFADNKEFITVMVYENGKRVFYPYDPKPLIDGVRINSPHFLCKLTVPRKADVSKYTLVVAQYEKQRTIYYTLRAYATLPFRMAKLEDEMKFSKQMSGAWSGFTAGGCGNYPDTFGQNPKYQLNIVNASDSNRLFVELKGPKQYSVGIEMIQVQQGVQHRSYEKKTSGSYRPGYCILAVDDVPAGVYNIMVTTFMPKQEGPFILTVKTSCAMKITKL